MILDHILQIFKHHPSLYHDKLLSYEWYFNGLSFNPYDQCWDVMWTRKNTCTEDTDMHNELHQLFPTLNWFR